MAFGMFVTEKQMAALREYGLCWIPGPPIVPQVGAEIDFTEEETGKGIHGVVLAHQMGENGKPTIICGIVP